jgi:carbon storage regulator
MLVLSRKQGERVHVGADVTLSVLEVKGKRVRIGIDAPARVPIVRGEVRARAVEHVGSHSGESQDDSLCDCA